MFNCKKCGTSDRGAKEQSVITEIRKVNYIYKITVEKIGLKDGFPAITGSYEKIVGTSKGTEIVNTDIYCPKCVPKNVTPKVVGQVERITMLKTVRQREREDRRKSRRPRRNRDNGRTTKDNKQSK
jgi:hypothetical protein